MVQILAKVIFKILNVEKTLFTILIDHIYIIANLLLLPIHIFSEVI